MKRKLLAGILLAIFIPGMVANATPSIQDLESQHNSIQNEITSHENELVNILAQIQSLESEISQKEDEIAETEENLAAAEVAKEQQKQQMYLRIRYNYENKEDSVFTYILTAKSFSDFLNQLEYAKSIYEYDNLMMDTYEGICKDIEAIKHDLEAQRAALGVNRQQLSEKQASLNSYIADARSRMEDVDSQLAAARAEAARIAAAQAAARRQQGSSGGGGNSYTNKVQNANPAPVTGVSGSAVISYANQFVGNPYLWGGNSLTNGVDCSGFVVQVYKHFGIDLSGSRHTSALEHVGSAVSIDNIQPGDIVCYDGHVGLYTGSGTIVEAQSSRAGITNNRSFNNRTILAIRRVI